MVYVDLTEAREDIGRRFRGSYTARVQALNYRLWQWIFKSTLRFLLFAVLLALCEATIVFAVIESVRLLILL